MGNRVRWLLIAALAVTLGVGPLSCKKSSSSSPGVPVPTISSVTPPSGDIAGSTLVTIVVMNFTEDFTANAPTGVTFGGFPGFITGTPGSDTVTATTPPGSVGFVNVVLTAQNAQTATLTNGFQYVASPGSLQFSMSAYTVAEGGATATITATRTGGSSGAATVDYATSDGTATAGTDYTAASGTLTWAAGDGANKTFTVGITDDSLVEGDETIDLDLTNVTGATLGTPNTAVLTITDDDTAGSLQFSAAAYSVNEGGASVTINVTRTGGTGNAVSVDYASADNTATAGADYAAANGTLNWAAGDGADKTFTVSITDDGAVEGDETVDLSLGTVTGGATLGTPNAAVLTIVDDDFPAGTLQFSAAAYNVSELGVTATITATRTGGSSGVVGVDYATSNGTATAGADYTAASGTLSWPNGDTLDKTFTVDITDDGAVEGDETVDLALSAPTGGATLGTPATAVLTIIDDDVPVPAIVSITPSQGSVIGGDSVTIVTVNFTEDFSATQPTDVTFGGVTGTATAWPAADTIVVDTPAEPGGNPGSVDVSLTAVNLETATSIGGFDYLGCFTMDKTAGCVAGGNVVALTDPGAGFEVGNAEVWFGANMSTVYLEQLADSIICYVPAGAGLGFVDVTVVNPTVPTQCTVTNGYEYVDALATSVTPANGPMVGGYSVTISGGGGFDWVNGASVLFGQTLAANVVVVDGSRITCDVPPAISPGAVDVDVKNQNDPPICVALVNGFTYDTPSSPQSCGTPVVTPNTGDVAGAEPVTITGSGFDEGPAAAIPGVLFGVGVATNVVVVNDSTITCLTPPIGGAAGGGAVDVCVVKESGGVCCAVGGFTYLAPVCNACTAASINTATANWSVGDAFDHDIVGTNFCASATVEFWQIDPVSGDSAFALGGISSIAPNLILTSVPPAPLATDGIHTPGPDSTTGYITIVFVQNGPAGACPPAGLAFTYN